jgi:hypothetical protein
LRERYPGAATGSGAPASEVAVHKKEFHDWQRRFDPREVPCAVCIPPGARLLLRDIPDHLQKQLGVGVVENVGFTQRSGEVGRHRDGFRFTNGQEILLQRLAERQRAAVLSLSSTLPEEETDAVAVVSLALA